MPRNARLIMDNVCYHVISRGNQSQNVFLNARDYNVYLHILRRYKTKYNFRLYAYCLMKNHVHLAMDPFDSVGLSKTMQGINQSYAIYFNSRYHKNGHLWQGRFKSMILFKDAYLLTCLNYIEMNPMRAGIIKNIQEYEWSSYRYRTLGKKNSLLDAPLI